MPIRELNDAIKVVHSTKVIKDNDEKNNISDGKIDAEHRYKFKKNKRLKNREECIQFEPSMYNHWAEPVSSLELYTTIYHEICSWLLLFSHISSILLLHNSAVRSHRVRQRIDRVKGRKRNVLM